MSSHTFGGWLKWQRARRGWPQREVEAKISVDHSQYSKWENEQRRPLPETRQKFHDLYGTSDDDLVELGILETLPGMDGTPLYRWAKAGYRPAIHEVPPDSREGRAAHLVTRIDWETQAAGFALTMLEQLAHEVPKRGRTEGD